MSSTGLRVSDQPLDGIRGKVASNLALCLLCPQFRENIQDVLPALPSPDDHFLLHWLQVQRFDLQESEAMLQKFCVGGAGDALHLAFWKQQDLGSKLVWQPPLNPNLFLKPNPAPWPLSRGTEPPLVYNQVVRLFHATGICDHDQEGGPIWYLVIRGLDTKGLLLSASRQEPLRDKFRSCKLLLRDCEQQSQEVRALAHSQPLPQTATAHTTKAALQYQLGKKVDTILAVLDFEGLGLRHLWKPGVEFAQEFFSGLKANYPEILNSLIIVKAPKLFLVAFNLIKSYMSEQTRRKVVILGAGVDKHSFLVSTAEADVPTCQRIKYRGEVPRSYSLRNQVKMRYEHTVTMSCGSSLQVENEILFPDCMLRWQFELEGDIGFGIFLKTKTGERQRVGKMVEVLPSQHYNAHRVPEDGSLTCLKAASENVLRFGNTYSLVHSKHISYTVEVLLPDQTFVEKIEKFEGEPVAPTHSSLISGSTMSSRPFLA
ncbi:LOW QUALITY PROTEIN: putative SEC14-like protein 6 [Dugong dugon]